MYTEQELAGIAKRENNTRRTYLVVNRLQGKHIPVSPGKSLAMFKELAGIVKERYGGEKLLLIGFAETATAIGAAAAVILDSYYMQTTRECIEGVRYLYFSEAHSHATEQRLVKDDMDRIIGEADRIVFIEDEVTTGNTILNIIDALEREYGRGMNFSVASLLNGMDAEGEERFLGRGIESHYLVKTDHAHYGAQAERYKGDGVYYAPEDLAGQAHCEIKYRTVSGAVNARRLTKGSTYQEACQRLWEDIRLLPGLGQGGRVLVLGTEEFMYPAMYAAGEMERMGCGVRFHATTRSPVVVSSEAEYPLHARYELRSLYDGGRVTYIYDLAAYDSVYIITDAKAGDTDGQRESAEGPGLELLTAALAMGGNKNIYVVRWCR